MKTRDIASLSIAALLLGGTVVGCASGGPGGIASASDGANAVDAKVAAREAGKASKALAARDIAAAVVAAERAVELQPRAAGYRMLLGQSYLQAGRFTSAQAAFADTLLLDEGNGKAALNLALAQIATGDWQRARATLATHANIIPASDLGLATALAGDPAAAVEMLTTVARSPAATPKVRQNLALAYALAGQWQAARVAASADMSPADVDARIEQWAAFAQPTSASDQVASLLGVRAVADAGQPTGLALAPTTASPPVALAAVETQQSGPVVVQMVPNRIAFAAPREVVQPLPAALIARSAGPIKVAASAGLPMPTRAMATRAMLTRAMPARIVPTRMAPAPATAIAPVRRVAAGGDWYVQLGAYPSAGVAKDAWSRAQRRYTGFAGSTPNGVTFKAGAASFYRLSLGGFSRGAADGACHQYRAQGGQCFVRAGAGDAVAAWAKAGTTQLALR